MPFRERYSVNFANGNLKPHVNDYRWPDMQQLAPTADPNVIDVIAESRPDSEGINLYLTRLPTYTRTGSPIYFIQVAPAFGLTLDRRLLTRVTFDLPRAERKGAGVIARQSQDVTLEAAQLPAKPEVWAIGLNLGPADLSTVARVTCQFDRVRNGVRLNTPRAAGATVGPIQRDQSTLLHSPLDYGNYDGGTIPLLDGSTHVLPPALFTLEHSFFGVDTTLATSPVKYTVGAGLLTISIPLERGTNEMRDHRLYSSNALTSVPGGPTAIGALSVGLGTTTAGRMSVRLRTFSVWENPPWRSPADLDSEPDLDVVDEAWVHRPN